MTRLIAGSTISWLGCAQLLGLEDTTLDRRDAAPDAPSVCDTPAVSCDPSNGLTVCGDLRTLTGELFTVKEPTGLACTTLEGPCGLTVFAQPLSELFAGTPTGRVTAQVDDCGHYAVRDQVNDRDVGISIQGADLHPVVRVVIHDPDDIVPVKRDIDATIVDGRKIGEWSTQLGVPVDALKQLYLARYRMMGGADSVMAARVMGDVTMKPPNTPWAAYFPGKNDTLDPALDTGSETLISPGSGTFSVGGFRLGKTCQHVGLQSLSAVVELVLTDC